MLLTLSMHVNLQIQLPAEYQVNRIVMKGLQDQGNAYYVKKYKLSYMNNGAEYTYLMVSCLDPMVTKIDRNGQYE